MKLADFAVEPLKINVDKKYHSFLPILTEEKCTFQLSGINNAIAAAIVRTIGGELPIKYLQCSFSDIKTDDVYIIPEQIALRIAQIPIDQKIAIGTTLKLDYLNNSPFRNQVKTEQFTAFNAKRPQFNQNITICDLNRGKKIAIETAVAQSYPYIPGMGALSVVARPTAIPTDIIPRDVYKRTGDSTSNSRPTIYNFSFIAHGTMRPINILIYACKDIIARARRIGDFLDTKTVYMSTHTYKIINESESIFGLFERIATDLFLKSCTLTARVDEDLREGIINMLVVDDIDADEIMQKIIDNIVATFGQLQKMFENLV